MGRGSTIPSLSLLDAELGAHRHRIQPEAPLALQLTSASLEILSDVSMGPHMSCASAISGF